MPRSLIVGVATPEWIDRRVDSGPWGANAQSRKIGAQRHGPRISAVVEPTLALHGYRAPVVGTRSNPVTLLPSARVLHRIEEGGDVLFGGAGLGGGHAPKPAPSRDFSYRLVSRASRRPGARRTTTRYHPR